MRKLLQINPVIRINTSTGRIMQEIGELAIQNGWESYVAYSMERDGIKPCSSRLIPVGSFMSTAWHGIETRIMDRHGLASDTATGEFVERIEELRPDIIHIHNIHGYFLNYKILFEYLSQCGIPVVWTVHDCWLYTGHCYYYSYVGCDKWQTGCHDCPQKKEFPASFFMDRSKRNYEDKKAAFTSVPYDKMIFVPVSEWIKGEMKKSFLKDYRFRVIHNGINTDVFNVYDDADVCRKYNLHDKHIFLGVASIWSREKGLDDFIKMAGMLKDDEVIVLVGLKEKEKKLLPEGIVGISRTENVKQLAELYSAADAFLNPTWQDNYPTVNLEAIACGTPVVTYRTGGSIEAITDMTGKIVERGDVDAMLKAAREIKENGKDCYTKVCRKFAEENFRKEDRYMDYIHLYDELTLSKK